MLMMEFGHAVEAAMLYQLRATGTNIVQLVGWCNTTIVVEYMPRQLETMCRASNVDIGQKLRWALDAAKGVAQLHAVPGGPVAHLDLEPKQFLLHHDGSVLLNDFNRMHICRRIENSQEQCTFQEVTSPGPWRSPEEYEGRDATEKADIYSLAMVFWSMESQGKEPFEGIYDGEEEAGKHVLLGERPALSPAFPKPMQELIQDMWQYDSQKRPSAAEVVRRLEAIVATDGASVV